MKAGPKTSMKSTQLLGETGTNSDWHEFRSVFVQIFNSNHTSQVKNSFRSWFKPFTPRVNYGDIWVILTFESVDEIISCDHSNESY